jgi:hypothetical protein
MNASIQVVEVDRDELDARVCGSLSRILRTCVPEKKQRVFVLLAGVAAEDLADRRQQYVDDLMLVAEKEGLIRLFGQSWAMEAITTAFSRAGL